VNRKIRDCVAARRFAGHGGTRLSSLKGTPIADFIERHAPH